MRGKGDKFLTIFTTVRITPAYAGKSCTQLSSYGQEEDHPRLCGEKCHHCALKKVLPGSPPPMRGKVVVSIRGTGEGRITPAYAGKSICPAAPLEWRGDHPRLCGEKLKNGRETLVLQGSPPPMRGKATCQRNFACVMGDHPRLCGEKWIYGLRISSQRGSPPPMRGKENVIDDLSLFTGITPAYAGKSQIFHKPIGLW